MYANGSFGYVVENVMVGDVDVLAFSRGRGVLGYLQGGFVVDVEFGGSGRLYIWYRGQVFEAMLVLELQCLQPGIRLEMSIAPLCFVRMRSSVWACRGKCEQCLSRNFVVESWRSRHRRMF